MVRHRRKQGVGTGISVKCHFVDRIAQGVGSRRGGRVGRCRIDITGQNVIQQRHPRRRIDCEGVRVRDRPDGVDAVGVVSTSNAIDSYFITDCEVVSLRCRRKQGVGTGNSVKCHTVNRDADIRRDKGGVGELVAGLRINSSIFDRRVDRR